MTAGVLTSFFLQQSGYFPSLPQPRGFLSCLLVERLWPDSWVCSRRWPLCVLWEWMMKTLWSCTVRMFGFLTLGILCFVSSAPKSQAVIYSQVVKVKFNSFKDDFIQMLSGLFAVCMKQNSYSRSQMYERKWLKLGWLSNALHTSSSAGHLIGTVATSIEVL